MTHTATIRAELERLALAHGGELRPEAVVDAARVETSPLHQSFDWDDTEAAQRWRVHQARQLIRAVVTYDPTGQERGDPCRVFVSLTSDRTKNGRGYRLTTDVLSDAEQRAQLLADAIAEMKTFREKYRRLRELADVFAAMALVEEDQPAQPIHAASASA